MSDRKPELEFWFDFGSNYSYLSLMRLCALQRQGALTVRWRPFLLGPIFKAVGWETSPFVLQKAKGDYMWRDMERQCEKYGLQWRRPSTFPRHSLLPVRVAMLAEDQPWMADFCEQVMLRNFSADLEIASEDSVTAALAGLGVDAAAIIAAAQSPEHKRRLHERTEQAQALGIFGAPTFFTGGEMYWGNDRLDDALAQAGAAPQSGSA